MASKKLRPGSFKSGTGGKKGATRRTGRTTGISQSAFGGYGFQAQHPATRSREQDAQALAEPQVDEAQDELSAQDEQDAQEAQDGPDAAGGKNASAEQSPGHKDD